MKYWLIAVSSLVRTLFSMVMTWSWPRKGNLQCAREEPRMAAVYRADQPRSVPERDAAEDRDRIAGRAAAVPAGEVVRRVEDVVHVDLEVRVPGPVERDEIR